MRASDAADHRAVLTAEAMDPGSGWLESSVATLVSTMEAAALTAGNSWTRAQHERAAENASMGIARTLKLGETCFVSADMTEFAQIAARELTEDDTFGGPRRLPMDHGVLFLEKSVVYQDVRLDDFFVDGFMWTTVGAPEDADSTEPVVLLYVLINNRKHPLPGSRIVRRGWGDNPMAHVLYHIASGSNLWPDTPVPQITAVTQEEKENIAAASNRVLSEGASIQPLVVEQMPDTVEHPVALFVAITRLMCQELVELSEEKAARPTRRRMERLNLKPTVTVISLRKKKYIGSPGRETGTGRHLRYRHLVRGHWKSQPHDPDCNGCKCKYVSHYFRGPEDGPLYVSEKVNALIR